MESPEKKTKELKSSWEQGSYQVTPPEIFLNAPNQKEVSQDSFDEMMMVWPRINDNTRNTDSRDWEKLAKVLKEAGLGDSEVEVFIRNKQKKREENREGRPRYGSEERKY